MAVAVRRTGATDADCVSAGAGLVGGRLGALWARGVTTRFGDGAGTGGEGSAATGCVSCSGAGSACSGAAEAVGVGSIVGISGSATSTAAGELAGTGSKANATLSAVGRAGDPMRPERIINNKTTVAP